MSDQAEVMAGNSGWAKVGNWLKGNAGTGAALVGSLLTGNVPGAVAAGVALVSSATGTNDATKALQQLQTDPATVIRLRELAVQEEASIRAHVQAMEEMRLVDAQQEHEQTQLTIRNGDNADDIVVRRTRPYQSWASLLAGFTYTGYQVVYEREVDVFILGAFLTLPWAYAGLREIGKSFDSLLLMRKKK